MNIYASLLKQLHYIFSNLLQFPPHFMHDMPHNESRLWSSGMVRAAWCFYFLRAHGVVFVKAATIWTCWHISSTGITQSSGCVMLQQEKICRCPLFVTQFVSKICQRFGVHPSPLMRDSPRRVEWLSAPLSVEMIELNFPQISRQRLLSALLCCGERLSDYHTIRKNVEKKKKGGKKKSGKT